MKTTEAIILAGGFGTRLKHIVHDLPKPMAPVNNVPFLSFVMKKLAHAGIRHIVLSTGYLHEKIESCYKNSFENVKISYAREVEPLGTGGAIKFALEKTTTNNVLILNGDTLFNIDFAYFDTFFHTKETMLAIALRREKEVSRYGSVLVSETNKIIAFTEKSQAHGEGLINGGIYLLNKNWLQNLHLPQVFSFEKEVLEKLYQENDFYGLPFNDYFIDIGIPEDYERAQREFATNTLFLDRDGVINRKIEGGYVTNIENFEFLPNVLEALAVLSKKFDHIFIVTNQQGIGKGVFSMQELQEIHTYMLNKITENNGRIDHIYVAPNLESENHDNRKPNIGMAQQAQRDYPDIDFSRAVMVGDSLSDMQFGKNAEMTTVFLTNKNHDNQAFSDFVFEDLYDFAIKFEILG